jgi:hypothetical protein
MMYPIGACDGDFHMPASVEMWRVKRDTFRALHARALLYSTQNLALRNAVSLPLKIEALRKLVKSKTFIFRSYA